MPYSNPERQRQYQREWCARRRREYFEGKCCVSCKGTEQLELHHVDPTKKASHRIWSWSLIRRTEELSKCEVRCHTCHKELHRNVGLLFYCGKEMKIRRSLTITLDNGEQWEKKSNGWMGQYVVNGRIEYILQSDHCVTGRLINALVKELEGHLYDASLQ